MAYHPQIDGTTEQVNQEIEVYLSIYCTSPPDEWLTALLMMMTERLLVSVETEDI